MSVHVGIDNNTLQNAQPAWRLRLLPAMFKKGNHILIHRCGSKNEMLKKTFLLGIFCILLFSMAVAALCSVRR
jgi:hypothetical protein